MKKLLWVLFLGLFCSLTNGQDITGAWNGALDIQGTQLRLVLHLSKTDAGYTGTLDSPDQQAFGIPIDSTAFANNRLHFKLAQLGITYEGTFAEKQFTGTFTQGGMALPLSLSREEIAKKELRRPQEPKAPFPYHTEDVTFKNTEAEISLAATLTLPKAEGVHPVVILISGSGPQDRNEELMGHKPFLVLADHLTRKGIGVLRYDDRGTAKSTGDFSAATTADLATDAASAIAYLKTRKDVDPTKIGLMGHSEGGVIAPMVAANNNDVSYIVLLAGTGIRGDKLLILQGDLIQQASGISEKERSLHTGTRAAIFDKVLHAKNTETLKAEITTYLEDRLEKHPIIVPEGVDKAQFIQVNVTQFSSPWMQHFIKYDPALHLEKVGCPVLALNGEKD